MKPLVAKADRTIKRYGMLEGGETVLVAVSGGPDSLALLHILNALKDAYELSLHVFHLNHMMRGKAGERDATFVDKTARKLGLPATMMEADVPAYILVNRTSPEDGARQVRYQLMAEVAEEAGADVTAVGHTADDRVETFLMRVVRGTGLDGLRSIPPVNGVIIRPLIEASRAEVLSYCEAERLKPVADETNAEQVYFRNKVRAELLPLLEKNYNPAVRLEILREVETIDEDVALLEDLTEQAMNSVAELSDEAVAVNRDAFLLLPTAIKRRLLRLVSEELAGEPSPFGFQNVTDIVDKVVNGNSGSVLDLPGGLIARREYDKIIFEPVDETPEDDAPEFPETALRIPGVTRLEVLDLAIEASFAGPDSVTRDSGGDVAFLDAGLVKGSGVVRPPREGDRFIPFGMTGAKKLSDVFTDSKTPRKDRTVTPVVSFNGQIVWVAGFRADDRFKVGKRTKRVLILRLLKGSS